MLTDSKIQTAGPKAEVAGGFSGLGPEGDAAASGSTASASSAGVAGGMSLGDPMRGFGASPGAARGANTQVAMNCFRVTFTNGTSSTVSEGVCSALQRQNGDRILRIEPLGDGGPNPTLGGNGLSTR